MADGDVLQIVAGHQAFAPGGGDSGVPDPAAAPDGQVVSTLGGTYTLESVSGLQTIRLLGPFAIAFDTPDLVSDDGGTTAVLASLPIGSLVVDVHCFITANWDGNTPDLRIGVARSVAPGLWLDLVYFGGAGVFQVEATGAVRAALSPRVSESHRPIFAGQAAVLTAVFVSSPGNHPTTGTADVYALIAEPSA